MTKESGLKELQDMLRNSLTEEERKEFDELENSADARARNGAVRGLIDECGGICVNAFNGDPELFIPHLLSLASVFANKSDYPVDLMLAELAKTSMVCAKRLSDKDSLIHGCADEVIKSISKALDGDTIKLLQNILDELKVEVDKNDI